MGLRTRWESLSKSLNERDRVGEGGEEFDVGSDLGNEDLLGDRLEIGKGDGGCVFSALDGDVS